MKFTVKTMDTEYYFNDECGYFRSVDIFETFVVKMPIEGAYESDSWYGEDSAPFEDSVWCNKREIDVYRRFGHKTSCLCPVDLENSYPERVYMKKAHSVGDVAFGSYPWWRISSSNRNKNRNIYRGRGKMVSMSKGGARKIDNKIKSDFFKLVKRAGIKKYDKWEMSNILDIYAGKYELRGRKSKLDYDKFTLDLLRVYKCDKYILSDLHGGNIGAIGNKIVITDSGGN